MMSLVARSTAVPWTADRAAGRNGVVVGVREGRGAGRQRRHTARGDADVVRGRIKRFQIFQVHRCPPPEVLGTGAAACKLRSHCLNMVVSNGGPADQSAQGGRSQRHGLLRGKVTELQGIRAGEREPTSQSRIFFVAEWRVAFSLPVVWPRWIIPSGEEGRARREY